ncbi:MAG TPA: cell division ATP-binding protein FtsE [Defluviitaleaceae bacterium]|nr:cell division ATP-binding protein FtsE [Candidatus Epulonipiscium sp.]HOQ16326.1 cell division ATP-binding protein FtsE [Defluviitaleaceae bacterium]HPT75465.1 cell division ATP-binding protein FtsE [Defluviitaleaceae bacterium]HQD49631.1 cell division ATP-binding protein FtsE [Defluviitaleaceae bacterium]
MIELHNVTKTYENGVDALLNVSLKIEKGEFVFIIGTSGSGKSTLIKLLLKEVEPNHGEIIVNNKNITKLKKSKIPYLRRGLGVVFQDFRLLPNKTVYENVAFAMQIVEASPKEIRRNVPMVLSMVGLARKARAYPNQLSGGEQQRTALARAIVNNPPILLADEPTGNLDPKTSWEIMKVLKDINSRGTTVIVATHDLDIVRKMKRRVIELREGIVVQDLPKGGYSYED